MDGFWEKYINFIYQTKRMVEKTNKLIQEFLKNKLDKKMGITWWNKKRLDHIKELIKNLERVKKELDAEGLKKLDVDGLETFLKSISDAYKGNDKLNEWLKSLEPLKTVEEIDKRIDSIVEFLQYHSSVVPKKEISIQERIDLAKLIYGKDRMIAKLVYEMKPKFFREHRDMILFQIYLIVIAPILSFSLTKRENLEEVKKIVKKPDENITKDDIKKLISTCIKDVSICEIGGILINVLSGFGAKVTQAKGREYGGFATGGREEKFINLKNWDKFFGENQGQFNITTSKSVLEGGSAVECTPIEYERDSLWMIDLTILGCHHLLCVFSNLTKAGGLSIHHTHYNEKIALPGTPLKLIAKIDFGESYEGKAVLIFQKTSNKKIDYWEYISMIKEEYKEKVERAA